MLPQPTNLGCSDASCLNGVYGSWPKSGEIDIMEAYNMETFSQSTVHVWGYQGFAYTVPPCAHPNCQPSDVLDS